MLPITLAEFADRLGEIFPTVIKEFLKRQAGDLYKSEITPPQFVILNFLDKEGQSRMTDLAHFMGVTTAAMTGLIERLVKSAYVERVPNSTDRRIIKIKLTTKGISLVKRVGQQRRRMIIETFARLSQKEREDYLKIITHIRDILTGQKNEKH